MNKLLCDRRQDIIYQELSSKIAYKKEFIPVRMLNAELAMDGNVWEWLAGDNPMEGIVGYGETPYKAMLEFNKDFHTRTIKNKEVGE